MGIISENKIPPLSKFHNKKEVKTTLHCAVANSNYDLVGKTRLFGGKGGGGEQIKEVRQLGDLFPVWN